MTGEPPPRQECYVDGYDRKQGTCRVYDSRGNQIYQSEYVDDKLEGKLTKWDYASNIKLEENYHNNLLHGVRTVYYRNGQKEYELEYKEGVENGYMKRLRENGKKEEFYNYKEGKKEGRCLRWYDNGIICADVEYKGDKVIKVKSLRDDQGRDCILSEEDIVVYKAGITADNTFVYISILVPKEANRVTPVNFKESSAIKSRIQFGTVTEIVDKQGKRYKTACSHLHYTKIIYSVGNTVTPNRFDDNLLTECSYGIHVVKFRDQCQNWVPVDSL